MEKKLKWQRQQLTKEQLEADFKDWIPDSGYSRTRDTKNFKLTEYTRSEGHNGQATYHRSEI